MFIVLWAISPFVLIPYALYLLSKVKRLNSQIEKLNTEKDILEDKLEGQGKAQNYEQNAQNSFYTREPTVNSFRKQPTSYESPIKQQAEMEDTVQEAFSSNAADSSNSSHSESQTSLNSTSLILILGSFFVILAGVIFASTSWSTLGNTARFSVMLIFAVTFFVASFIAKKLSINKTSAAFYTLATAFLPISIFVCGCFSLLGEYLSIRGEGAFLLFAVMCASLCICSWRGCAVYKSKPFCWVGMTAFSGMAECLFLHLSNTYTAFIILSALFAFLLTFLSPVFNRTQKDGLIKIISEQINLFALLNNLIISVFAFVGFGLNEQSGLAFMIFAASSVKAALSCGGAFSGAVPSMFFLTFGLISVMSPNGVSESLFIAVIVSAAATVMSLMGLRSEKLTKAFSILSIIFTAVCALFGASLIFAGEQSVLTSVSLLILSVNTVVVALRTKSKGAFAIFMFQFILCINSTLCLAVDNTDITNLIMCIIVSAIGIGLMFVKIPSIIGAFTDVLVAVFQCFFFFTVFDIPEQRLALAAISVEVIYFIIVSLRVAKQRGDDDKKWAIGIFSNVCSVAAACCFFAALHVSFASFSYSHEIIAAVWLCAGTIGLILLTAFFKHSTLVLRASMSVAFLFSLIETMYVLPYILFALCIIFVVDGIFCFEKGGNRDKRLSCAFILAWYALYTLMTMTYDVERSAAAIVVALMVTAASYVALYLKLTKKNEYKLALCISMVAITALMSLTFGARNYAHLVMCCIITLASIAFGIAAEASFHIILSVLFSVFYMCNFADTDKGSWLIALACITALQAIYLILLYKFGRRIQTLAYTSCLLVLIQLVNYCADGYLKFFSLLLASACLLSFFKKGGENKACLTLTAFAGLAAWLAQPFADLNWFSLEYKLIGWGIFIAILIFMYSREKDFSIKVFFTYCIVSLLILCGSAMSSEYLADSIFLLSVFIIMFITAIFIKRRRWLYLSVTGTLFISLYMSRSFWQSLGWWAYLLIIGVAFILIGAGREMSKKKIKDKIDAIRKWEM